MRRRKQRVEVTPEHEALHRRAAVIRHGAAAEAFSALELAELLCDEIGRHPALYEGLAPIALQLGASTHKARRLWSEANTTRAQASLLEIRPPSD